MIIQTCGIQVKPVEVKPSKFVSWLQKYNPLPIVGACVRYDVTLDKWALLDSDLNPKQHFIIGVMKNVVFSSAKKIVKGTGCGGNREENIGLATGDLYLHKVSDNPLAHNLAFRDGQFVDNNGAVLSTADEVILMSERRALYK